MTREEVNEAYEALNEAGYEVAHITHKGRVALVVEIDDRTANVYFDVFDVENILEEAKSAIENFVDDENDNRRWKRRADMF